MFGNFIGNEDDWAKFPNMTCLTKKQVMEYFKDFEIIYFKEKKYVKDSVKQKNKNWHVFEIYAKKK